MQVKNKFRSNIYDDPYMREAIIIIKERAAERKKSKKYKPDKPSEVLLKKRSINEFLPDGNEDITIVTLFTILPYIAGVIFSFFVIAGGSITKLISLSKYHSFPLLWAIGYEILAFLALVWIVKIFISSFFHNSEPEPQKKPTRRRR